MWYPKSHKCLSEPVYNIQSLRVSLHSICQISMEEQEKKKRRGFLKHEAKRSCQIWLLPSFCINTHVYYY